MVSLEATHGETKPAYLALAESPEIHGLPNEVVQRSIRALVHQHSCQRE